MVLTHALKLRRLAACRSDLLANGIDLDAPGRRRLCALVRRHLEYFQAMLGYDAALREIVALVGGRSRARTSGPPPR